MGQREDISVGPHWTSTNYTDTLSTPHLTSIVEQIQVGIIRHQNNEMAYSQTINIISSINMVQERHQ